MPNPTTRISEGECCYCIKIATESTKEHEKTNAPGKILLCSSVDSVAILFLALGKLPIGHETFITCLNQFVR
jgi:hypothetical protein